MPTSGDFPLQLSLPLGSDPVDVSVLNANFETINTFADTTSTDLTAIKANGWVTNERITSMTANKLAAGTVPSGVVVEYVASKRVYIQQGEPSTSGWNAGNAGTVWISW
jgi:hypothetical protein